MSTGPGYSPSQAPFYSQQPYRPPKRNFPVWAIVLTSCCCCAPLLFVPILAAIFFPAFAQARAYAREANCMSNIKQNAMTILVYSQDYDEHFPPGRNWMTRIDSYFPKGSDRSSLHCPEAAPLQQPDWQTRFGYAYDSRLSSKAMAKIDGPEKTWMLYDSTNLSRDATDPGVSLAYRHIRQANVSMTDGHVTRIRKAGDAGGGNTQE